MMRIFATFLVILAVDVPFAPAFEGSRDQQEPKNLVLHPSLEGPVGGNGLPHGWDGTYFQPEKSYEFLVIDGGRTGDKSLVIQGKGRFGVVSTNKVLIDRNMRYRAGGWVRIEGDAQAAADVKFHYFDARHQYLGQTRIPFVSPPAKDWTLLEITDRTADFPEAKWIQVAVALDGNGKAQFDDLQLTAHPRAEVPDDFDSTPAPELKVLSLWIGAWEGTLTVKAGEERLERFETRYTVSNHWILGGRFIQGKAVVTAPSGATEYLSLTTYDARDKVYRCWEFSSPGTFPTTEITGKWDDGTQTLTWNTIEKDRATQTKTIHFIDKDTYEQMIVNKGPDGKVLLDLKAKATRRK